MELIGRLNTHKLSEIWISQMAVLHPRSPAMALPGSETVTPGQLILGLLAPNLDTQLSSLDLVLASGPGFPGNPNPAVVSLDFASSNWSLKLCGALAPLCGRHMNGHSYWVCGQCQSYDHTADLQWVIQSASTLYTEPKFGIYTAWVQVPTMPHINFWVNFPSLCFFISKMGLMMLSWRL